jgi:hypothetical protein
MKETRKQWQPISDLEKKSLWDYYDITCSGKASGKQCQQWFLEQYAHTFAE